MEIDKEQISIIKEEDINREIEEIKISYEKHKELCDEQNVKLEDVINTLKIFSEKSAFFAKTIIISLLSIMPLKEYTHVIKAEKEITKEKIIKTMTKIIAEAKEEEKNK